MPQRRGDYMSTKNVGGNRPVDPESGPAGVSLGFKVQPEHAYLGHFKAEKFLRKGHNQNPIPSTVMPVMPEFGRAPRRAATLGGTVQDTARRGLASRAIRSGDMSTAMERPVLAAKLAARAAGITGAGRRAIVSAARMDPNSRLMERRARRARYDSGKEE